MASLSEHKMDSRRVCLSLRWPAAGNEEEGTVPAGQLDMTREEMRGRGGTGPYREGEKGAGDITTGRGTWDGGGGSGGWQHGPASQPPP